MSPESAKVPPQQAFSSQAARRWSSFLVDDASLARLLLIAGPLILASGWMLISPSRVVSREMT